MKEHTILLVRHPEAYKNIEDRHGGQGTSLTPFGLLQCDAIAKHIAIEYQHKASPVLVGHRIPQVEETISFLSGALKVEPIWDDRLRGLNLGFLAGLSRAEAAEKYPGPAEQLELWRAGKLPIHQLQLPGAESLRSFNERVEAIFAEWLHSKDIDVVVAICTRSTLIMLANLAVLHRDFSYDLYKVYNFRSGSITKLISHSDTIHILAIDDVSHMEEII